jgi:hypothetical protein
MTGWLVLNKITKVGNEKVPANLRMLFSKSIFINIENPVPKMDTGCHGRY